MEGVEPQFDDFGATEGDENQLPPTLPEPAEVSTEAPAFVPSFMRDYIVTQKNPVTNEDELLALKTGETLNALRRMWRLSAIQRTREGYYGIMKKGHICLLLPILCLFVLIAVFAIWDIDTCYSWEYSMFSRNELYSLNKQDDMNEYYSCPTTSDGSRVFTILVSGLSFSETENSPELKDFISSDRMRDSRLFKTSVSLPSRSMPNWLNFLSGAPPEMTGLLSADNDHETHYDTVFSRARHCEVKAGVSAFPLMRTLVEGDLVPLVGYGSPGWKEIHEDTSDESYTAKYDKLVKEVTTSVMNVTNSGYRLFFSQFEDAARMGAVYGTRAPPFFLYSNNKYADAVKRNVELIESIIDTMDANTTLVITSDYGMDMRGGHGGGAPSNTEVPTIVYRKDSGLGGGLDKQHIHLNDLPTFVTAVLGIPAPREAVGNFPRQLIDLIPISRRPMVYKDLYIQKSRLVSAFIDSMFYYYAKPSVLSINSDTLSSMEDEEYYRDKLHEVMQVYYRARAQAFWYRFGRNFFLMVLFCGGFAGIILWYLHAFTFADPLCLIHPTKEMRQRRTEISAILIAGASLILQVAVTLMVLLTLILLAGNDGWDWNNISEPFFFLAYITSLLLFSSIACFVAVYVYHWCYMVWRPPPVPSATTNKSLFYLAWLLHKAVQVGLLVQPEFRSFRMIYLIRVYRAVGTAMLALGVCLLISTWDVIIPGVLAVQIIDFNWTVRFYVHSFFLLLFPMLISACCELLVFPLGPKRGCFYDPVYSLGVHKEFRASRLHNPVWMFLYFGVWKAEMRDKIWQMTVGRAELMYPDELKADFDGYMYPEQSFTKFYGEQGVMTALQKHRDVLMGESIHISADDVPVEVSRGSYVSQNPGNAAGFEEFKDEDE